MGTGDSVLAVLRRTRASVPSVHKECLSRKRATVGANDSTGVVCNVTLPDCCCGRGVKLANHKFEPRLRVTA